MQSALRTFFRFALHEGYLRQPLDRAVPTLRTYKLATVPRGLTEQQTEEVLRGIERDTEVGRRDYAILQLLSTYGVRGGQLRTLRLDELDWARDRILFKAAKHGKDVWVPMTLEVGEAVLDYLQNGRPACSCPEVFLTSRAPYHPFPHSSTLSAIVQRRLCAAGIDLPSAGGACLSARFRHPHASAGQRAEGDRGCARSSPSEYDVSLHQGGFQRPEASGLGVAAGGVEMRAIEFHSCVAAELQRFVELRRAGGSDYQAQARLLLYFDRFLAQRPATEPRLTREITEAYQETLGQLHPRTRDNRLSVVRQFCEYLSRTDPRCYIPERRRGIRPQDARRPHIYSASEVQRLLAAAAELPPPNSLRPHTYRTLLGLLYSTGIRIGEAFALNLEDFHREEQNLYVAAGKFRKARWVSLSGTASDALGQYVEKRQRIGSGEPNAPLFLNGRGRRLCHPTVHGAFRRLLSQCGIPHHRDTGPRIHDLRHTFAVHRLLAWYRDGQDVNARLPWLATYLGHVDIQSTQVYLHATAELLEQVDQRFHRHYLQHVKSQGGAP